MALLPSRGRPDHGCHHRGYSTAHGTAVAGFDYQAANGILTFAPGGTLSQTLSVSVLGDPTASRTGDVAGTVATTAATAATAATS